MRTKGSLSIELAFLENTGKHQNSAAITLPSTKV